MIFYLVLVLGFILFLFLFGIPKLTNNIKVSSDLRLEEIGLMDLFPAGQKVFQETDAEVAGLQFRPLRNFSMVGLSSGNENRIYLGPDQATFLIATVIKASKTNQNLRALEFTTVFEDGLHLSTSNGPLSGLFDKPDWQNAARFPGMNMMNKLYAQHYKRVQEKLAQGGSVKYTNEIQLMEDLLITTRRIIDYQVEKGLFRVDEQNRQYVATPKIALRGVINYINPLANDFTLTRFTLGFGLGLLVAVAAVMAVTNSGLETKLLEAMPYSRPGRVFFLLYCPGFFLAGLIVGWQFPHKGFFWGFIVSLPAMLFLPHPASHPIYYSIIAGQSGYLANCIREAVSTGEGSVRGLKALLWLIGLAFLFFILAGG